MRRGSISHAAGRTTPGIALDLIRKFSPPLLLPDATYLIISNRSAFRLELHVTLAPATKLSVLIDTNVGTRIPTSSAPASLLCDRLASSDRGSNLATGVPNADIAPSRRMPGWRVRRVNRVC